MMRILLRTRKTLPPGLRTRFTSDSTCFTSRTEQSTCVMMTWSTLSSARPSDSPSRGSSSIGNFSPSGSVLLRKMGWKKLWVGGWVENRDQSMESLIRCSVQ